MEPIQELVLTGQSTIQIEIGAKNQTEYQIQGDQFYSLKQFGEESFRHITMAKKGLNTL